MTIVECRIKAFYQIKKGYKTYSELYNRRSDSDSEILGILDILVHFRQFSELIRTV